MFWCESQEVKNDVGSENEPQINDFPNEFNDSNQVILTQETSTLFCQSKQHTKQSTTKSTSCLFRSSTQKRTLPHYSHRHGTKV